MMRLQSDNNIFQISVACVVFLLYKWKDEKYVEIIWTENMWEQRCRVHEMISQLMVLDILYETLESLFSLT